MRIERPGAWCEIENGIAVLALSNAAGNTLGKNTRTALLEILELMENDLSVSVVILTGDGEKFFCAGADLNEEAELKTTEQVIQFNNELDALYRKMVTYPKPVIGAINGYAVGGGYELALSCDFRYVAHEAKMGAAGVRIGLVASADTLPKLIGAPKAKELLFTGRQIDGLEAERVGIANRSVPRAELLAAVKAVAAEIAKAAPLSVAAAKQVAAETASMSWEEGRKLLRTHWRRLQQTQDHKEALRAFKEKRPPVFQGK